jgi:hypothetical protein
MKKMTKRKVLLNLNKTEALESLSINNIHEEYSISITTGNLTSMKMLSESVLVIDFENCEVRLDMTKNELNNVKYVK